MSFEILPDELLLIICSYLNPIDVLQAFNNLNTRLNSTISNYRKQINLTQIRYGQFNQYCHMLLQTNLGFQVQSLSLSNKQPVLNQLTLFTERVWPLNQKLPNLECLTLCGITYDELNLFLPSIMCFEKLTELTITCGEGLDRQPVWESFHNLTKNFHSLRKITLQDTCLSLGSISDWNNDTITHMTLPIVTTTDLIILLYHFHSLQFLNVSIAELKAPEANYSFDNISSTQLNEFHMKTLQTPDLSTFDKLTSLLMNMSNLKRVKYEICLSFIEDDENTVIYLNGRKWHVIRTQFDHLVNFDCTVWIKLMESQKVNSTYEQIIASFSQFPDWFVNVCRSSSSETYICAYTKTPKLFDTEIDHDILRDLDGHQIATLIDSVSSIYMYVVRPDTDNENTIESSPLVLPDRIISKLDSITVGADCYMHFNERLESFLKQLFSRTPNLKSIQISTHGSGNDYDDIADVLSCIEKPSISIKNCSFYVKADYNESRMKEVIFHLPMLTSLTIRIIYSLEDFVAIVNTCCIHSKHLLYLELTEPYSEAYYTTRKNIQLWLRENTLLGDATVGRAFHAIIDRYVKIWL